MDRYLFAVTDDIPNASAAPFSRGFFCFAQYSCMFRINCCFFFASLRDAGIVLSLNCVSYYHKTTRYHPDLSEKYYHSADCQVWHYLVVEDDTEEGKTE